MFDMFKICFCLKYVWYILVVDSLLTFTEQKASPNKILHNHPQKNQFQLQGTKTQSQIHDWTSRCVDGVIPIPYITHVWPVAFPYNYCTTATRPCGWPKPGQAPSHSDKEIQVLRCTSISGKSISGSGISSGATLDTYVVNAFPVNHNHHACPVQ